MEACLELRDALLNTRGIDEFLGAVARIAAQQVGAGVSCGMTMRPNGRSLTVACTDRVAAQVDEIQYRLDEGPCLHAMRDGEVVSIPDTANQAPTSVTGEPVAPPPFDDPRDVVLSPRSAHG